MNKIYYYDVESADGSGILSAVKKFEVSELSLVGENDTYIAVNDSRFTTIQKECDKERCSIYPVLNDPSVSIYNNDNCWGNRLHYILYSETTVTSASIKKRIEREIDKRFGYFTGKIDLSFIMKGAKQ